MGGRFVRMQAGDVMMEVDVDDKWKEDGWVGQIVQANLSWCRWPNNNSREGDAPK